MSSFNHLEAPTYGTLQLQRLVSQKRWRCSTQCSLRGPRTLIGRHPEECDLVIKDSAVSRVHAEIFITAEKRVYLICHSKKKEIRICRRDEVIHLNNGDSPRELRNMDDVFIQHNRIVVGLLDISERFSEAYSSGTPYEQRTVSITDSIANPDVTQIFSPPQNRNSSQATVSLTPNIDRARTVSTSPAMTQPFITSSGRPSGSVRIVKRLAPMYGSSQGSEEYLSQETTSTDHNDIGVADCQAERISLSGGSPKSETYTTQDVHDEAGSSEESKEEEKAEETDKPPKSILKSARKTKRRKSVRFSAFSDEASIVVKAKDGSGGVTPAKKVFPPHIQKGISAVRASPSMTVPMMDLPTVSSLSSQPIAPNLGSRPRHATPFPLSSSTQMTRHYGIGGPLSSIRRGNATTSVKSGIHMATPRPTQAFDVPVAPRSPGLFTTELAGAGLGVRSTLSSRKLFDAVSRLRQTPAKYSRLTPMKKATLDSVYRGLTHLNIRTPRVPETPMALEMQFSPIQQRASNSIEEDSDMLKEDITVANLVSDMVSLLDLQESETEKQEQQGSGFSVSSFFSSFMPGRSAPTTEDENRQALAEIRDILEEEPSQTEDGVTGMEFLRQAVQPADDDEEVTEELAFGQSQQDFIRSQERSGNCSQLGIGSGVGASFTMCDSPAPRRHSAVPVVKRTFTPETDREEARQDCIQMFDGLANSLGVSADQIPAIAAHKMEFALECLKNKIQGDQDYLDDEDDYQNGPGPAFEVNGAETAKELSQIFETSESDVSRVVSEHLKAGLTQLLNDPDQMVNLSPESRNFAIASLSEVVAAPDSAEKMSSLLVSAPKTVKSPLSVLDGVCAFVKTPSSVAMQTKRVRINPNAQFHDDECEMSDEENGDTVMGGLGESLDLSGFVGLVNDFNPNSDYPDDQEEPTAALQKDLYSQFKEIEKTERFNFKVREEPDEDDEPEEVQTPDRTDELKRLFSEKHSSNLSGLGFTNVFSLHRPDDDNSDEDVDIRESDEDDALPVDFLKSNDEPTVVSVFHEANASFTSNETARTSTSPDEISPEPTTLDAAFEQESAVNEDDDQEMEQVPAPQSEDLGWQRKRRLSEPIPLSSEMPDRRPNAELAGEFLNTSTRKRRRSEMSPTSAVDGPPRKRLRTTPSERPIRATDSLAFRSPLEVALGVAAFEPSASAPEADRVPEVPEVDEDGDIVLENVVLTVGAISEEKEPSHDSDTDQVESESDDDQFPPSDFFAIPRQESILEGQNRGRKRGLAPESPRVGKTKLFHQSTNMEELPPLNLARCASSFSAPAREYTMFGRSWCTNVTVNGFPFLSFDDDDDVEEDENDMIPESVTTEEIVAIDMDEPVETNLPSFSSPKKLVALTPLRRICAQRVRPLKSGSKKPTSFSARSAVRTTSRLRSKNVVASTPKPKSRRVARPSTDIIDRSRRFGDRRRSGRGDSVPLETLQEFPNSEVSMMMEPDVPLANSFSLPADDVDREDSLPSVRESVDGDDLDVAMETVAEEEKTRIVEEEVDDVADTGSVIEMDIRLPTDWSGGQAAEHVAEDLGLVGNDAGNDELVEESSAEVYSIPIRANKSLPHNECPKISRKRTLRDAEEDETANDVTVDATESSPPHVKRRRVVSPKKLSDPEPVEDMDVEMTETHTEVETAGKDVCQAEVVVVEQVASEVVADSAPVEAVAEEESESEPVAVQPVRSRRKSLRSRAKIVRKSKSAKASKSKPVLKPVRRSMRIANRIRRQSEILTALENEKTSSDDTQSVTSSATPPPADDENDLVVEDVEMESVDSLPDSAPVFDVADDADTQDATEPESEHKSDDDLQPEDVVITEQQAESELPDAVIATEVEPSHLQPVLELEVQDDEASDHEMPSTQLNFVGEAEVTDATTVTPEESLVPLETPDLPDVPIATSDVVEPERVVVPKSSGPLRIGGVELHHLRVVDLKKELKKRSLNDKGKKRELIERLSIDMKNDVVRPSTKRKTKAARARTHAHGSKYQSSQKRQTKKKIVRQTASSSKVAGGRTRVSTQKKQRQMEQAQSKRAPLQSVAVNGQSGSTSIRIGGSDINQLRAVDLRRELKKRNLDTAGKKADLISRLTESVQSGGRDAKPLRRRAKRAR